MNLRICCALLLACITLLTACGSTAHPAQPGEHQRDTSAFITSQLRDLSTLPCPAGVQQQTWDQLRTVLRNMLEHRLTVLRSETRTPAVAPTSNLAKTTLTWNAVAPALEWRYYNPGDYNQDGEVNISDLTPLAVHLGQSPPANTTDDVRSVIDGDSNGVINISDLTPLGANLGHRIMGYNVFTSFNVTDYPFDNAASSISPLVFLPLNNAVGPANTIRLGYSYNINLNGSVYYWVRPMDVGDETEGPASNYLLGGGSRPNASFTATQIAGEVPLVVGLNAATSSGLDPLTYYWDLNGDGVYEWNGGDTTVSHNFTTTGAFIVGLRVVDANGYSDTATMTFNVNIAKSWKRYGLPELDPDWDVQSLALGYLDGLPWLALGIYDQDTYGVWYFRGGTPTGSAWSDAKGGFSGVTTIGHTMDSVLAANGPALAWSKTDFGAVYYSPSAVPYGSGWNLGMAVAGDLLPITDYALALINNGPAVAYYSPSSDAVIYTGADPSGTSWSAPEYVVGPGLGVGMHASLAEINGHPAVAYFDPAIQAIKYIPGTGAGWGTPVIAQGCQDCAMFDGLFALPDGSPAIVYHDKGMKFVHSARGTTPAATVWASPAAIAATDGEADLVPRVVVADSKIHVFYYRSALDELLHSESNTALGGWSAPDVIASGIDGSALLSAADLGGYPGVAYLNAAGEPRVAIKY